MPRKKNYLFETYAAQSLELQDDKSFNLPKIFTNRTILS